MTAREDLYEYATVAFKETGVPPVIREHVTKLLDAYAAEVRTTAADDVHRAELPTFPGDERPELVAKVVRAVDIRITRDGPTAPYGVPKQP